MPIGTKKYKLRVGTAGWTIPRLCAAAFAGEGSHLERYAGRFYGVEINSSFYRTHRAKTYVRWAASVPGHFKFAVKAPQEITHDRRLVGTRDMLRDFLGDVQNLGEKLGPILVQCPPSLAFDRRVAVAFFKLLRRLYSGQVVCEPRHLTWFDPIADTVMKDFRIARVAADPARGDKSKVPGGWRGLSYWRLHGSPDMYRSPYTQDELSAVAKVLARQTSETWCIFDNTTLGKAMENALSLRTLLGSTSSR